MCSSDRVSHFHVAHTVTAVCRLLLQWHSRVILGYRLIAMLQNVLLSFLIASTTTKNFETIRSVDLHHLELNATQI